jgi:hypothetical protein
MAEWTVRHFLESVEGVDRLVLPDGPATRGAATSLRAEAFGWALPLVANQNLVADQREDHATQ